MDKAPSVGEELKPEGNGFNLDGILSELGSFGKYQLLLLLLLSFRDSFLAMCNFNYVFTAPDVASRCHVPECETLNDIDFNASWTQFALRNDTEKCFRRSPILNSTWFENNTNGFCVADAYRGRQIEPCEKIVYENYDSVVAEFDLGCQPWKRTLIGTVHYLGLVFSFVASGFISDRYGRKVIIVGTPLMVGIAGLVKSFSINYWMLIVLEFLEAALGYGNASMVLSLETVHHQNRVVFSCISDIMSNFGGAFFALIAWKVPYWRNLIRAIYAPLLVVVFYIFLVDEGVRWLLAHNKKNEAVRVLNKVAKINNVTLSTKAKEMLEKISEDKNCAETHETKKKRISMKSHLVNDLRSRVILFRVFLCSACFFCGMFVYHGAIINSTSLSGSKYLNFSLMLLVSIPTRVITALTLTRFGRKVPICVAYCLCAVCFVSSALVPKSIWWSSVLLYIAGKMCSSYGIFSLNVVAMEVFPTTSRNSLANIACTVGRLGSVLAPQAPLLAEYMAGLPSMVFGIVALVAGMLALLLPDSSKVALPEDVRDAENIEKVEEKADKDEV